MDRRRTDKKDVLSKESFSLFFISVPFVLAGLLHYFSCYTNRRKSILSRVGRQSTVELSFSCWSAGRFSLLIDHFGWLWSNDRALSGNTRCAIFSPATTRFYRLSINVTVEAALFTDFDRTHFLFVLSAFSQHQICAIFSPATIRILSSVYQRDGSRTRHPHRAAFLTDYFPSAIDSHSSAARQKRPHRNSIGLISTTVFCVFDRSKSS